MAAPCKTFSGVVPRELAIDQCLVSESVAVAEWLSAPLVPVTVKVNVPRVVFTEVTDSVEVLEVGFGAKLADEPGGRLEALSVT